MAGEIRQSRRHCRVSHNQHGMKRREQDFDKNFILNQYEERLAISDTKKYQNLWVNNKVRGD